MENYQEEFDPADFVKDFYPVTEELPSQAKHTLRCYHDALQKIPNNVKVLDYGAGPVIFYVISAAAKASEIVLAEYTEKNRKCLRQWLAGDPDAFNWCAYFQFVVKELECKGDQAVKERQEQVREKVKAVVHCDINKDPPIAHDYNDLYDVVMTSFVMEGVSTDLDDYQEKIARLGRIVKPGGLLLVYGVQNTLNYVPIGHRKFPNIEVTHDFAVQAIERAGFGEIYIDTLPENEHRVYRFIRVPKVQDDTSFPQ